MPFAIANRKSRRQMSIKLEIVLGIVFLSILTIWLPVDFHDITLIVGLVCLACFLRCRRFFEGEDRIALSLKRRMLPLAFMVILANQPGCSHSIDSIDSMEIETKDSGVKTAVSFTTDELATIHTLSPLPPLAPDPTNRYADNPAAARLGHRLFYEPRLSADGSIACASCHAYTKGFGEGGTLARGLGPLTRHSIAIWNVAYSDWFFWDGRVDTLWGQALEPLEEPAEHGMTRLSVLHVLHDTPLLRKEYETIFGELPQLDDEERFPPSGRPDDENPDGAKAWAGMTEEDRHSVNVAFANVGKAFAAYERKLVSRRAPFDIFVEGTPGRGCEEACCARRIGTARAQAVCRSS